MTKVLDKTAAAREIKALREDIERHRRKYYLDADPVVSDSEYDTLERHLKELETQYPELDDPLSPTHRVGGEPSKGFVSVEHEFPMLSLDDAFDEGELRDFDARLRKQLGEREFSYLCELKIDGLSIALRYDERGRLLRAVTRGDGRRGDDVTHNAKTVRSIPLTVSPLGAPFEVRGEIFMPKKSFERLNRRREEEGEDPFANPRNAAAGSMRQLNPSVTAARSLDSYMYDFQSPSREVIPSSQVGVLEQLARLSFHVEAHRRLCRGPEEVLAYASEWKTARAALPYDTDGLVVKLNELALRREAGATSKFPRWAVAYKFPPERAVTVLEKIVVQVGRTGALTPVAELRPVKLAGSTISRATLHNEDEIARKDVREGDTVEIEKGGDIIPKVIKVVPEKRPASAMAFRMPDLCPACRAPVFREEGEAVRRCVNADCPAKLRNALLHFVKRNAMNVEGLGPALVDQMMAKGMLRNVASLYTLRFNELISLERMGEKSAQNLLGEIEKSKRNDLSRLLFALGIRHVGERAAALLADRFGSMEAVIEAPAEEIESVYDLGPAAAESLRHYFQDPHNLALLDKLRRAGVNMKKIADGGQAVEQVFKGKIFVLTGTLSGWTRPEAKKEIERRGGRVTASVSKKTAYVLAGKDPGSKLEKAHALGVSVMGEEEFERMLGSA